PADGALAFDAAAGVVVAHSLRVADFLHVVDRDVQPFAQPPGACVPACAPPRPLAVDGHQHHGDVGDGGLRLDVGLDAGAFGDPLPQVGQIGRGVTSAAAARTPAKPAEQCQLGRT